jgi:isoleucyl-tRNA synthetase
LSGLNAKKHPEIILDFMREPGPHGQDWVFLIENYKHRYPACWRCKTELVWKVADEWYIAMDKPGKASQNPLSLRERMKAVAKQINWIPSFGLERELDWLSNMHDWLISKPNRYWGLALPIYECEQCGQVDIIGSKTELKDRAVSGWEAFEGHTPHKPWIDAVKIKCSSCGAVVSRLPDVGNVWLDAGIISFSTLVDPKTGEVSYTTDKNYWSTWYPADFITESFPGQFKNWFYSMIAMATVLEDKAPYQTVLGYASMLGEDGRPMHKSWGNSIEFNEGATKIGVDIMRWMYSRHNPLNNLLFGYKLAGDVRRQFFLILYNSYRFFVNSAVMNDWSQPEFEFKPVHVLDRWILSRFNHVLRLVEQSLDAYDSYHAAQALEVFVQDLSTWYIRRSRDRVNLTNTNQEDRNQALTVMSLVFTRLAVVLSPFMPFVTEEMYQNLTGETSVHLATWPEVNEALLDDQLEQAMALTRQVVTLVHAKRKEMGIKVRQPLAAITVIAPSGVDQEIKAIIADEVNVKQVDWRIEADSSEIHVELDAHLTPELIAEGKARDLIRNIMDARKQAHTKPDERVVIEAPEWPDAFTELIKTKALADELRSGETLKIIRYSQNML